MYIKVAILGRLLLNRLRQLIVVGGSRWSLHTIKWLFDCTLKKKIIGENNTNEVHAG